MQAKMLNLNRNSWLVTNAIVIASVFVIKHLNQNVGYSNGGGCDPWYFFGLYQDYFNLRLVVGGAYQFNRFPALLPWIFLGPHISAVALTEAKFWTYLLISSVCFSYAAIALFGARSGPLTSILFLGSTLFIGALSTDFVTGAGLAWECALIATTVRAAKSELPATWLVLAGALCACCIYTHIPMAMFIFSTPLYLFLRSPRPTIKDLAGFLLWMIVGFLMMTLALCLVSLLLKGDFIFFRKEFLAAFNYLAQTYPRPRVPQWFSYDTNIPVFGLAAATSLLILFRLAFRRAIMEFPAFLIPALVYLAVAILCFGFEFSNRMVLQDNVFAPWMLPSAFLAIGSALSLVKLPNRALSMSLCVAVAVVLVWAASRMNPGLDYWWRYILAAGALVPLVLPLGAWSTTGVTVCISALLMITYPTGYGSLPWYQASLHEQGFYELVRRAHRFITIHSGERSPSFWISAKRSSVGDPGLVALTAPESFFECGEFPASYPSPQIEREGLDQYFPDLQAAVRDQYVSPDRPLFIIAPGHDLVASASGALNSVGLSAVPLDETEIAPGISIAVADIK